MISKHIAVMLFVTLTMAPVEGPGVEEAFGQDKTESVHACTFSLATVHESSLEPGGACTAKFHLRNDEAYVLRAEQVTGDIEIRVLGADGAALGIFDQTRSPENEVFRFATAQSGEFTLVVTATSEPSSVRILPGKPVRASEGDMKASEADNSLAGSVTALEAHDGRLALQLATTAVDKYAKLFGPKSRDVAIAHMQEAYALWELEDLSGVLAATSAAIDLLNAETVAFDSLLVNALNAKGGAFFTLGRITEAIPLVEKSIAITKKGLGPDHPDLVLLLNNLGEANRTIYRYEEADRHFRKAQTIAEKHAYANPDALASAFNYRGLLSQDLKNFAVAFEHFSAAIVIYDKLPDLAQEGARVRANVGVLFTEWGRYADAERYLKEALEIRRRLATERGQVMTIDIARNQGQIGSLYQVVGDGVNAERFLKVAVDAYNQVEAPPVERARATNSLAIVLEEQHRLNEAESLYRESIRLVEAVDRESPDLAYPLANLARFLARNGNTAEAAIAFERSLAIRKKNPGPEYADTAEAYMDLADHLDKTGRARDAEEYYAIAGKIYQNVFGPRSHKLARLYSTLSRHRALLNDPEASVTYGILASESIESGLEISMLGGSEERLLQLAASAAAQADYALSLHLVGPAKDERAASYAATTVLRTKGRVFDAMAGAVRRLRTRATPADTAMLDRIGQARVRLAGIDQTVEDPLGRPGVNPDVVDVEREIQSFTRELSERRELATPEIRVVRLADIRARIPAGTMLVEFALYTPQGLTGSEGALRYAVVLLSRDQGPYVVDLETADLIDDSAHRFREELRRQSDRKKVLALGKVLYGYTVGKFADRLTGVSHLLIAPDGELSTVPFAALVGSKDEYLIKRFEISYITSGRELLDWDRSVSDGRSGDIVVVAGPPSGTPPKDSPALNGMYPPPPQEPVPMGMEQARLLKRLFPDTKVFPSFFATESSVKATRQPRILHICAHGFFREPPEKLAGGQRGIQRTADIGSASVSNPMLRSGIYLAEVWKPGSSSEDGVLTALEAMSLDLRGTTLVSLSACDSGLGDRVAGEGVFGLRRALSLAGARSQLVSLWRVQGEASLEFIKRFYTLLKLGLDARTAITRTQREMLDGEAYRFRHPGAWAAFVLVGEPVSLAPGVRADSTLLTPEVSDLPE